MKKTEENRIVFSNNHEKEVGVEEKKIIEEATDKLSYLFVELIDKKYKRKNKKY